MSLLDDVYSRDSWERFYSYKTSLSCPKRFASELRSYIDNDEYMKVTPDDDFALPKKSVISKMSTQKKRTVYTYPYVNNVWLKLLTHLLLRKYDYLFCDNLYSFRPGITAKDAVERLVRIPDIGTLYSYKVDISNYFNSIDVSSLIPMVEEYLSDDPALIAFLSSLLSEPYVIDRGCPVIEQKGIMAGTPQASFFANLYLKDLDKWFDDRGIIYARYSDDIILFARTEDEIREYVGVIRDFLNSRGLAVNPSKEVYTAPGEMWVFLGFCYKDGVVDIAPASITKIKGKMRRKARALKRWQTRKNKDSICSAKAFIRVFNRKLFEAADDNDLTWSKWYFPAINTTSSLLEIDHYAQDCIRFLMTGKHNKGRYRVSYEEMKALGYKCLVNVDYKVRE